eukprot:m.45023 g.45023  ORF g.45023 m.45023 type:complete len:833 (-) comp6223_c0_seq1:213-2711(-)
MTHMTGAGLGFRIFVLFVLPVLVLLPVAAALDNGEAGETALVFFMLLPYLAWALVWLFGKFTGVFDVDEWFLVPEMIAGGVVFGAVLPVLILVPVYFGVDMADKVKDVVLAYIIALPAVWLPIPFTIFWTPFVQEEQKRTSFTADRRKSGIHRYRAAHEQLRELLYNELTITYFGMFFSFSLPLAFFLPLLLGVDPSDASATALVFFLLLTSCLGFFLIFAPRFALLFSSTDHDIAEAIIKLLWGGFLLPVVILLPIYFETGIEGNAKRMLLAFIVGLPSVSALEAVRVMTWGQKELFVRAELLLLAVLVIPLGLLLPLWLATDPGETGQVIFLVFMLTPLVIVLCFFLRATAGPMPDLPFKPLNWFLPVREVHTEFFYALFCILFFVILLLPVVLHGDLEKKAKLTLITYMAVLSALTVALFFASLNSGEYRGKKRAPGSRKHNIQGQAISGPIAWGEPGDESPDGVGMMLGPAHADFTLNLSGNTSDQNASAVEDSIISPLPTVVKRPASRPSLVPSAGPSSSTLPGSVPAAASGVNPPPPYSAEPSEGEFAVGDWELASSWGLDRLDALVCINNHLRVKIDDSPEATRSGHNYTILPLWFSDQPHPFVCKGPIDGEQDMAMKLLSVQRATQCANEFNTSVTLPSDVSFVQPVGLRLETRSGDNWCLTEPNLERESPGKRFSVFVSARGLVTEPEDIGLRRDNSRESLEWIQARDVAAAFSCFSHMWSGGQYLFLDIRGVGTRYSIPSFENVSVGSQQDAAHFFLSQHVHNSICAQFANPHSASTRAAMEPPSPTDLPPPPPPTPGDASSLPPPPLPPPDEDEDTGYIQF